GRLPRQDAILRHGPVACARAGDVLRLVAEALVAEETQVDGILIVRLEIEAQRAGIFVDRAAAQQLGDIKIRIYRSARQNYRSRATECGRAKRVDRRARARATRRARDGGNEVDPGAQAIAFIAAEEEELVFDDRAAE